LTNTNSTGLPGKLALTRRTNSGRHAAQPYTGLTIEISSFLIALAVAI
jgi:hypothetical protein